MKAKKLFAAVLATMLVLTAILLVACNNTEDMSKNIYEGNYTTADEKAVEQLQADVQKLATDNTDKDGKTSALGYRLAINVNGKTDIQGVSANIDGAVEGLLTSDEKQNVSAQLSLKLNVTATNPETQKEENVITLNGNAWAFTESNRGYADYEMEMSGTKMSAKYYADLTDLKKAIVDSGADINIDDIVGDIDPEEAMQQLQYALKDTNTKIYVDGDNKYKVETKIDDAQTTIYFYKTNDGKMCVKMETVVDGLNVSLDLRPSQSKVSMPKDTSEYKKFDGNIKF